MVHDSVAHPRTSNDVASDPLAHFCTDYLGQRSEVDAFRVESRHAPSIPGPWSSFHLGWLWTVETTRARRAGLRYNRQVPSPGPSTTAALVASTLLLLRDDPAFHGLVDDAARDRIEAAVRTTIPAFGTAIDRVPWALLRQVAFAVERLVSPGFIGHYALRKHAIREHLKTAAENGFRQVVLVGAGFDMLSSSLPESVTTFEVDLAATQAAKRAVSAPTRHTHYVSADLAHESLFDALRNTGAFDPRARTVFVAEGLLMYLTVDRVASLLDAIAGSSTGETRVILSVLTPDAGGRFRIHSQRRVVDLCMRWLNEPFVWGIERGEIAPLLSTHGLRLEHLICTTELRDALLPRRARRRIPRRTGELVVVASGGPIEPGPVIVRSPGHRAIAPPSSTGGRT